MKKIYLVILLFIPLSVICQNEEKEYSYNPTFDSVLVDFYKNLEIDCNQRINFLCACNNRQLKKEITNTEIKYFHYEGKRLKDVSNLNKFPNMTFLFIVTSTRVCDLSEADKIDNLKFIALSGHYPYVYIPEFVKNQFGLLGISTYVDTLDLFFKDIQYCNHLCFMYLSLNYMQEIPKSILKCPNLYELELYSYAEDFGNRFNKYKDENVVLFDRFHHLVNLRAFKAPIDLGINYIELSKLPNLIDLSVDTCSISEFKELDTLMDKLVILNIENINEDDLNELRIMYPNVRINESILTRKEAYDMGLISQP